MKKEQGFEPGSRGFTESAEDPSHPFMLLILFSSSTVLAPVPLCKALVALVALPLCKAIHVEKPSGQEGGSSRRLAHPAPDTSITPPWISQSGSENPILAGLHTAGAIHSTYAKEVLAPLRGGRLQTIQGIYLNPCHCSRLPGSKGLNHEQLSAFRLLCEN